MHKGRKRDGIIMVEHDDGVRCAASDDKVNEKYMEEARRMKHV